jgi:hypothetical protein
MDGWTCGGCSSWVLERRRGIEELLGFGVLSDEEEVRWSGLCCLVVGLLGRVEFAFMVVPGVFALTRK